MKKRNKDVKLERFDKYNIPLPVNYNGPCIFRFHRNHVLRESLEESVEWALIYFVRDFGYCELYPESLELENGIVLMTTDELLEFDSKYSKTIFRMLRGQP